MTHLEIKAGEGLSLLADRHGFAPDTVWLHPQNRALRELRRDGNTLHPGDLLFIPECKPRGVDCVADAAHRFVKRGVPAVFQLRLLRNGRPRADEACVLEAGGLSLEMRTDPQGIVRFPVPPGIVEARLQVGDDPAHNVRFGRLETPGADPGAQRRLANLGLYAGPCDEHAPQDLSEALSELQRRCGLPVTGVLDGATERALRDLHDRNGRYPEVA
jgi:N-acetylmuramoyl-L-alanine amidase